MERQRNRTKAEATQSPNGHTGQEIDELPLTPSTRETLEAILKNTTKTTVSSRSHRHPRPKNGK